MSSHLPSASLVVHFMLIELHKDLIKALLTDKSLDSVKQS